MKHFRWDHEKNAALKSELDISFEQIVFTIEGNGLLDTISHPKGKLGTLPSLPRADRMVRDWAQSYQTELLDMWSTQQFKQLPGLE